MPRPSAPPETKADRTRRRIVEAAAQEFAERGYEGTSLRQIAAAAELKPGSLYFHFASKEELIAEVLRDAVDLALERVRRAIDALGPDAPAGARLRAAIEGHLDALHGDHAKGAAVVRLLGPLPASLEQEVIRDTRRYGRFWTQLLADAQRAGAIDADLDPRVVRDLVLAALNDSVWAKPGGPRRIAAVSENLTRMLLR